MDLQKMARVLLGQPLEDATRRSGLMALSPPDEMRFQQWAASLPWHEQFQQKFGEQPNLNDPQYDYRRAYASGASPAPYEFDPGMDHWPGTTAQGQSLKGGGHPTAWMNEFIARTGIDPNAAGVNSPEDAAAYVGDGRRFMKLK